MYVYEKRGSTCTRAYKQRICCQTIILTLILSSFVIGSFIILQLQSKFLVTLIVQWRGSTFLIYRRKWEMKQINQCFETKIELSHQITNYYMPLRNQCRFHHYTLLSWYMWLYSIGSSHSFTFFYIFQKFRNRCARTAENRRNKSLSSWILLYIRNFMIFFTDVIILYYTFI